MRLLRPPTCARQRQQPRFLRRYPLQGARAGSTAGISPNSGLRQPERRSRRWPATKSQAAMRSQAATEASPSTTAMTAQPAFRDRQAADDTLRPLCHSRAPRSHRRFLQALPGPYRDRTRPSVPSLTSTRRPPRLLDRQSRARRCRAHRPGGTMASVRPLIHRGHLSSIRTGGSARACLEYEQSADPW